MTRRDVSRADKARLSTIFVFNLEFVPSSILPSTVFLGLKRSFQNVHHKKSGHKRVSVPFVPNGLHSIPFWISNPI